MANTGGPDTGANVPAQPANGIFGFVETPAFRRWAIWGLAVVCALLFVVELLLPAKLHSDSVRIPGKYALIAIAAVGAAALAGWVMSLLRRDPDYYGEARDRAPEPDESVASWRAEERGR